MNSLWSALVELQQKAEPFVIVTLIEVKGSSPQDLGAKAVIDAQGLVAGTVGGGKVEARAIETALHILQQLKDQAQPPQLKTWNLQRDIGMTCGGEVKFLFECHPQRLWPVVIFGAGHVAQALVRVLLPLNCQLTVIDERRSWLERLPISPKLKTREAPLSTALVSDLPEKGFFVVMTKGHSTDLPILAALFNQRGEAPYIGVMGSQVKGEKLRLELRARGVEDRLIERLHCPIGLPLGSNDPEEIALSVTAQLLAVRGHGSINNGDRV